MALTKVYQVTEKTRLENEPLLTYLCLDVPTVRHFIDTVQATFDPGMNHLTINK